LFALCAVSFAQEGLPVGWMAGGGKPAHFEIKPDTTVKHGGAASASVRFIATQYESNSVLMQQFKADAYRGKRVRMSAWVKTETANDIARLWLRIDTLNSMPSFDNMGNRPIRGVTDWKRYEIVLDVPAEAVNLAFGVMSFGTGRIWVDDFAFEAVGADVAETDLRSPAQRQATVDREWLKNARLPAAPLNLDFESGAAPVRQPVPINPKIYDDYTGLYQVQSQAFAIKRDGDKLMMEGENGDWTQAWPLSETEFFLKGIPGSFRFIKDANGKVTEVIANLMGGERHVKRLDLASAKARGAQIMAAAYQAKGGLAKLKAIRNVWHDGVRTQDTTTTTFDLYLSDTIQFLQETRDLKGRVTDQSISDGRRRWFVSGLDATETPPAQFGNFARNMQLIWLEFTLLPFPGQTLEAVALDDAEYQGKPVEVVAALIGDNKYVLSFDKQNHLLRRITLMAPNTFLDYSYDNYFDVNGLQMAGDAWIGAGGAKRHVKISKYKLNAGIDAARLAPGADAASPEAQLLRKQEEALRLARLNNDVAALEQLVAEDYVGTNQYGERRNKASLVQLYAPGNIKVHEFTMGKFTVRLSGDVAIVSGEHSERTGSNALGHQLFTHVWVKRDGRWQLLSNTQFIDPNKK
jgi:ketosteroid isomerase-like protein